LNFADFVCIPTSNAVVGKFRVFILDIRTDIRYCGYSYKEYVKYNSYMVDWHNTQVHVFEPITEELKQFIKMMML
jgi:hypothetical protein